MLKLTSIGGMKKPSWIKKNDPRRFKWEKKFGALPNLPTNDFDVYAYSLVKDQFATNICQSEAVAYSQEAIFKQPIDEGFQRAATNAISGKSGDTGDADPYDADKGAIKIGSIPLSGAPYLITDPKIYDIANYVEHYTQAKTFTEVSSYDVRFSGLDMFDSIRNTLAQGINSAFPNPVRVGCKWYSSWLGRDGGFIDSYVSSEFYTYHEFTIIGQKTVNGVLCLKAILSSGDGVGDRGYFYFTRNIANTFMFGLAFGQGSPADYKKFQWNILQKAVDWLVNILNSLNKK